MKQNLFREFVTETGTTASAMWIKDAVTRCLQLSCTPQPQEPICE